MFHVTFEGEGKTKVWGANASCPNVELRLVETQFHEVITASMTAKRLISTLRNYSRIHTLYHAQRHVTDVTSA